MDAAGRERTAWCVAAPDTQLGRCDVVLSEGGPVELRLVEGKFAGEIKL